MATLLQVFQTHGPTLVYNRMATTAELAFLLAWRTVETRAQVLQGLLVLCELHVAIRARATSGTLVMLDVIGWLRPAECAQSADLGGCGSRTVGPAPRLKGRTATSWWASRADAMVERQR